MYKDYCIIRDLHHVTDYQVAKETGITRSTFTDWKSGRSKPKIDKLMKIAQYFGVSVEMINGECDRNPENDLSPDERELLRLFRNLSSTGRTAAISALCGLQSSFAKKADDSSKVG